MTPQQPQSKDWEQKFFKKFVRHDKFMTDYPIPTLKGNVADVLRFIHTLLAEERSRIGERLDKLVMSEKYKGDTMLDLDDIKALLDV